MCRTLPFAAMLLSATSASAQSGSQNTGEAAARLLERINLSASDIRPGPAQPAEETDTSIDIDALAIRLSAATRDSFAVGSLPDGGYLLSGNVMEVTIDNSNGRVSTRQFVEFPSAMNAEDQTHDDSLLISASELTLLLGARLSEIGDTKLRNVGSMQRSRSGSPQPPRRIARVVYIKKSIGGLPVMGERLTFVYDLTGRLKRISGRWTRTIYAGSKLTTTLSSAEIATRAAEYMANNNINIDGQGEIVLRTLYKPQRVGEMHVVDIHGAAVVELRGPGGAAKRGIYEFPL